MSATVARFNVNVAVGRSAWQMNTYCDAFASRALDGKMDGDCASTWQGATNPWWAVDLGVPSYVRGISLTNVPQDTNGMTGLNETK